MATFKKKLEKGPKILLISQSAGELQDMMKREMKSNLEMNYEKTNTMFIDGEQSHRKSKRVHVFKTATII